MRLPVQSFQRECSYEGVGCLFHLLDRPFPCRHRSLEPCEGRLLSPPCRIHNRELTLGRCTVLSEEGFVKRCVRDLGFLPGRLNGCASSSTPPASGLVTSFQLCK